MWGLIREKSIHRFAFFNWIRSHYYQIISNYWLMCDRSCERVINHLFEQRILVHFLHKFLCLPSVWYQFVKEQKSIIKFLSESFKTECLFYLKLNFEINFEKKKLSPFHFHKWNMRLTLRYESNSKSNW